MIAVYFGKDDFSAHEALDTLRDELNTDGMLADNTTRFDGASARHDELLAACQTVPLLGGHRLIVVHGLLAKFQTAARRPRRGRQGAKKQPDEPALGDWQPFVDALPALPESTALIFMDGELTAGNPLLQALRALKPDARIQQFNPLPQAEIAGWIVQRAPRYGVSLEARAVAALAALAGNNLWLLDSELQKLATYAGDRQVTEDDVRSLVSLARDPSVFAMADAVIEGRTRDATDLLQRLLVEGEAPQRLLAMVARQYRMLLLAKELLEQRVSGPEIAKRLGVQGFVIQRLLKQAPAYTVERLRQAYRRLLEADLSVKRGIYDDVTALDLLFFELAALAKPAATRPGDRPGYSRPRAGPGPAPSGAARGSGGRS